MELNWTTLILEIVNFLILVWILKHFLYRPVLRVIEERRAGIAAALRGHAWPALLVAVLMVWQMRAVTDEGPAGPVGGLYETGGRAWVVQPDAELVKRCFKPGDWNEMTVTAQGKNVRVELNGVTTAEVKDDPGRTAGYFGLQLHGGNEMHVEFKDIEIQTGSSP